MMYLTLRAVLDETSERGGVSPIALTLGKYPERQGASRRFLRWKTHIMPK